MVASTCCAVSRIYDRGSDWLLASETPFPVRIPKRFWQHCLTNWYSLPHILFLKSRWMSNTALKMDVWHRRSKVSSAIGSPQAFLAPKDYFCIARDLGHDLSHEVGVWLQMGPTNPPPAHPKCSCVFQQSCDADFILGDIQWHLNRSLHPSLKNQSGLRLLAVQARLDLCFTSINVPLQLPQAV